MFSDKYGKRNVKYAYEHNDDGALLVGSSHDTMHNIDAGTFSHKKSFIKARVADTYEHRFVNGVLDSVRHTSSLEVKLRFFFFFFLKWVFVYFLF